MSGKTRTVVVGAGIVGVSAAIWLRRSGVDVTLVDRCEPGQGTSFGNAGVLASCAMVPVTTPGLATKGPKFLLDPNFPLFMRWPYLPKLAPWLMKYLGHANDTDTRRISKGLTTIVGDSVEQHSALANGSSAAAFVRKSDYCFAYESKRAFDAESYIWQLRAEAGFVPELIQGQAVRETEPALGPSIDLLAVMKDHGYILNPGAYVSELARVFETQGGRCVTADVQEFELSDGRISAVLTDQGKIECDNAVVTTGVWSKPLLQKLGIKVPMESERGYHILFKEPSRKPKTPIMIAAGKFVATPMEMGLRCAGVVEFGGLKAGPSQAPVELLKKKVAAIFPDLKYSGTEVWLGHRPALTDSLPMIGEIGKTGVFPAFGHHHIGLTAGPKTGRLVAGLVTGNLPNVDMTPYDPHRFNH